MKELQQKQKIKRRIYSVPALIILFIITVFTIRGTYLVVMKDRESSKYVNDLKAKMSSLLNRETQLKTEIARLGTSEGVDTLIKEKFSVSKPDEHVVVIVDEPSAQTSTSTPESNWFQKLWRGFLDLW
jgi:cell division protein FtsB